jgi:integrase
MPDWTSATAQQYLAHRADQVGQKTLDLDRQALQILPAVEKLERTKSEYDAERKLAEESRGYSAPQVAAITAVQNPRNALATSVAAAAGLRAHELLTLRPAGEQPVSDHRAWSPARFAGLEGARYTVTGKGGLTREVVLPTELAERLEARRLAEPVGVKDRGVHYQQVYDLAAGKNWSASFSSASQTQLGYSTGAHGLRHGYAQQRMDTLQGSGQVYEDALLIVSQEMGYFRPDITEVYLR